jgi:hypothetical protein
LKIDNESNAAKILRQIVRGERPWTELDEIGIQVRAKSGGFEIRNSKNVTVIAGAQDLALGILAYQHDPVKVREWASMILAGAIPCDLQLKETADEQDLLSSLWDISFGKGILPSALTLARHFSLEQDR